MPIPDIDPLESKSPAQKEDMLRKIWGIEFIDRVIFNADKIASIESHFLQLRDSCKDGLVYEKALRGLFDFRKSQMMTDLYDTTIDIHLETKVPYYEFKKKFPIVPPILTSCEIERTLHTLYYPSTKRHPADMAQTLEEKADVLSVILGETRFNQLADSTFEETCKDAEQNKLRDKFQRQEDYEHELARLASENHDKLILRLHRTLRYFHYVTQQPYEKVPSLLTEGKLKPDPQKFRNALIRLKKIRPDAFG